MSRSAIRSISIVPIPALIASIAVIYVTIEPSLYFDPAWVVPITHTIFVTFVYLAVAYIAARNYQTSGRVQILLLGCGLLSFGIGGAIAGWLPRVPGDGANLNVTVYTVAALAGAISHFAAAFLMMAGVSAERGAKRKRFWLVFSYAGIASAMALFSLATVNHLVPPFFVSGMGFTALRQALLGTAAALFAFSFTVFLGWYIRNREEFLYWYACALALASISLAAFFIERSVGSPIGWAGRFSQYLGGIYFLMAIRTAAKTAQAKRTSFDNIIAASLSPADEKFRALAEDSPDVIDRFDRDLRHLYINPAGLRLYGKPASAILGRSVEEAGAPQPYASLWKNRIQQVFETGQPIDVEEYFPTPEGTKFLASHCVPEYGADGMVANVLVLSRDLTERKHAEQEIRRRNLALDSINRIFQEALNCATAEELGKACLRVAEAVTESKFGFIGELGADGLLHHMAISDPGWQACSMYEGPPHKLPHNLAIHGLNGRVLKDGRSLLVNAPGEHPDSVGTPPGHPPLTAFLGVPLMSGERVAGIIAVANRDGGYRQDDQDTLEAIAPAIVQALHRKRSELALIRSEKLASVGRLAATIAHEINNPLAGATNAVYLVKTDSSLAPATRDMAEVAEHELRRAAQIARRILGFYREPNADAAVVIGELFEELATVYAPKMRDNQVRLCVRCEEPGTAVTGNVGELRQLFSNLLSNSIDAVHGAGRVHLRARGWRLDRARCIRITVADTGTGIEPELLKRVFEPFFTTKKDVGTGLGLWICEQIVAKHGGSIRIRSRVGWGTVIAVKLPAAHKQPAAAAGSGRG